MLTDWRQLGITATTYTRLQPTGNSVATRRSFAWSTSPYRLAAIRHCCWRPVLTGAGPGDISARRRQS